jgi:hypothetical protein
VDSGPSCLHRLCPAVGCTLVIPEEFVEKFCPEKLTKYRHFQLETFVAQNKVSGLWVEQQALAASAAFVLYNV